MTRPVPRALSLQNYWENPRMKAVRDGASRAGKKPCGPARIAYGPHTGILSIARARCELKQLYGYINPDFSVKKIDVSEHYEFDYPKIKKKKTRKKKGKARWSYNKMLFDWVRSGGTGKYLALLHGAQTSPRSVRTPWPRAKYFPVRPSHSLNKYIIQNYWILEVPHKSKRKNLFCNLRVSVCVPALLIRLELGAIYVSLRRRSRWTLYDLYCPNFLTLDTLEMMLPEVSIKTMKTTSKLYSYWTLVLSTRLIKPKFCFDLSHRRSTTVSLETRNLYTLTGSTSRNTNWRHWHGTSIKGISCLMADKGNTSELPKST